MGLERTELLKIDEFQGRRNLQRIRKEMFLSCIACSICRLRLRVAHVRIRSSDKYSLSNDGHKSGILAISIVKLSMF